MFIISNEKSNITLEEQYEQGQKHHLMILKQNKIIIFLFWQQELFLKTIK